MDTNQDLPWKSDRGVQNTQHSLRMSSVSNAFFLLHLLVVGLHSVGRGVALQSPLTVYPLQSAVLWGAIITVNHKGS